MSEIKLKTFKMQIKSIFYFFSGRQLKKCLTEDVIRDLMSDAHALSEVEREWEQLKEDRDTLRQIFPSGDSKIVLPCNLQRMIWNAHKIFKIDKHKTTDLHPNKIIDGELKGVWNVKI